ncbi:hypothetical protein AAFN69_11370 [Streptomyces sp. CAU 1734]
MGWMTDEGRHVLWWLLGFAAANGVLGCRILIRGRADRATIRRVGREGIGPVEAAWQADGERRAVCTAVGILVLRGAVEVSKAGVVTAVPGAREPADPVLSALLEDIRRRGAPRTRLHEILESGDFETYRSRLGRRVPEVRRYAEPGRVAAAFAACGIALGMTAHGLAAGVRLPIPGRGSGAVDRGAVARLGSALALRARVAGRAHPAMVGLQPALPAGGRHRAGGASGPDPNRDHQGVAPAETAAPAA